MTFKADKASEAEKRFVENPCNKTRNEMIMQHTGIVHLIARKYIKFVSEDNYEDLFQEGMIGLMTAAEKFDPEKGVKFSTYAGWWVRANIQVYITDDRAIYFNTLKKLAFDRNPGKELPNEKERRTLALQHPFGLNSPINRNFSPGDFHGTWQDIIADPEVDVEKQVISAEQIKLLHTIAEPFLGKNKYRRTIFKERLVTDSPKTLKELGQDLNLSREGVRLHERALLQEIKNAYQEYVQHQ